MRPADCNAITAGSDRARPKLPGSARNTRRTCQIVEWPVGASLALWRRVDASIDRGTQLAIKRTRLAYERNMMAWIRTAASLISFGFTVYKFFDVEAGKNLPAATGRVLLAAFFAALLRG